MIRNTEMTNQKKTRDQAGPMRGQYSEELTNEKGGVTLGQECDQQIPGWENTLAVTKAVRCDR